MTPSGDGPASPAAPDESGRQNDVPDDHGTSAAPAGGSDPGTDSSGPNGSDGDQ
jgi:hypothetical protein